MRYRVALLLLVILAPVVVRAQQYRFHQYRVEHGLPSDVIKAVTQDSLGFFWIATDDGLVKYDGIKFTAYKDALRSQFVKGFLHTKDGKLFAFGDLDVIEIHNQVDTVLFTSVLKGQRFFTDTAMWFPKSIYEDKEGAIWLGEPKSVLKYQSGKIRRYDLGEENRSTVFVRSFSFFEDKRGNFYAVSYTGNLLKYSQAQDKFIHIKNVRLPSDVSQVLYMNSQLLVAARNGLFLLREQEGNFTAPENIFPVRQVSNLLLSRDSSIIVSTYEQDLYVLKLSPQFQWDNLYYNFNGINSVFLSNENDMWAATDKGLVRIQRNLFVLGDVNSQSSFVEGITYDEQRKIIYYCSKEKLIQLSRGAGDEWARKILHDDRSNYFQSLQYHNGRLWASSNWKVLIFDSGKLMRTMDFSGDGNFVHDIFLDKKGRAWLSQAGSDSVKMLDDEFNVAYFSISSDIPTEINLIREGSKGMYGAGSGVNNYLFLKSENDSLFRNVSAPLPFDVRGDFNVQDIAIAADESIWLGTTEGLLRFQNNSVSRIRFGDEFEDYPVSSVEILDDENILFSNSFGLFRLNIISQEYWLYDENSGLPSNTITDHGIFVSQNDDVWIGTSYGLAYAAEPITLSKKTGRPHCVEARVNGIEVRYASGVHAPYGSFITLLFSPISFPENKITLQWKMAADSAWKTLEDHQLNFSNLDEGTHEIYVRAKKNTGFSWSDYNSLNIIVDVPYWKQSQFIFLVVLLVILIAWASYAISAAIMSQRREYLQQQIRERTQELQKANEELTIRNNELDRFVYSASHDLSAPLKSILGLIRVAQMDKPGENHSQYLGMMERSVNKLEAFIQEVVTYSRNTRMPVKYDRFCFKDFVNGLLQDHEFSPNYSRIRFDVDDQLGEEMISDIVRMKIILNNLISNAIKFHWIDSGREPYVRISVKEQEKSYVLEVSDNGRGIEEEHLHRIFEMFYRATDGAQGSGLGLYILKESVLKLNGKVSALSTVGQGTTFRIILPVPVLEIPK